MNNAPDTICRFAFVLLAANPAWAGETPDSPLIRVGMEPGAEPVVTLEARNAPLARVLDQLAARTGIAIHYSVLPETPVTATCAGASVKPVLRCLLGPKADFLIRTGGGEPPAKAGKPPEIWILGSSLVKESSPAGDAAVCAAAAGVPKDARSRKAAEEAKRKREQAAQVVAQADSQDPVARAASLDRLAGEGLADEATVRRILEKSLADQDSEVRAKAVWGLARRSGPDSAAILQSALHDPELSVRLTAIEAAGADADGMALLQEAAGDSDEGVRAVAEAKLESLRSAADKP